MSMRSDYELTVKSDIVLRTDQLKGFLEAVGQDDIPINEHPLPDAEDEYLRVDADGKGFYLLVRECHPEEFAEALDNLSQYTGATFHVDEYIREATEMVEAGRSKYIVTKGKRKYTHLNEQELATVLAALRYWQKTFEHTSDAKTAMLDHFNEHAPLQSREIDELCERLNFEVTG